jgi:hypothetical protein
MGVPADIRAWAETTFGDARLGDRRRTRRLVHSAARIAALPEGSFNQVMDRDEPRGFYNLCHRPEATPQAVMGPHWEQTRAAMARHETVLIVHDTTELDYSSHRKMTGPGQVGNERGRGLLQHNSLAIVPRPRRVLGLTYQQCRARVPAPPGETTYRRRRRARESDLWAAGIAAPGRPPQGRTWVDVADRGADDYEAMRAALAVGHHFLFRVHQDRRVFPAPARDRDVPLVAYARSLAATCRDAVEVPARGGRPGRVAEILLAGAPVWVPAPADAPRRREQPVLPAWAIRVWEPSPPPGCDEPLEWLLLCSLPSATGGQLLERRDWYCLRWVVEQFHLVGKVGCREEARRFETADRMVACLAVLSLVAVRVLQLRYALEATPGAPAEAVASAEEVSVLGAHLGLAAAGLTVRGVARLGGFLGRKHDGEPGVRSHWRGVQRLHDLVRGHELGRASRSGFI